MRLFKKKPLQNFYNFIRVEKWCSKDERDTGFVGYAEDGSIYLTFDVRKGIPVFSGADKIGGSTWNKEEFANMQELYVILPSRWIEQLDTCIYKDLFIKENFQFNENTGRDSETNSRTPSYERVVTRIFQVRNPQLG